MWNASLTASWLEGGLEPSGGRRHGMAWPRLHTTNLSEDSLPSKHRTTRNSATAARTSCPQRHTGLCPAPWPNHGSLPLGLLPRSLLRSLQERRSRPWISSLLSSSNISESPDTTTSQTSDRHRPDTTATRPQTPDPRPKIPRPPYRSKSTDPESYLTTLPYLTLPCLSP